MQSGSILALASLVTALASGTTAPIAATKSQGTRQNAGIECPEFFPTHASALVWFEEFDDVGTPFAKDMSSGDLDGDGFVDLVTAGDNGRSVTVHFNDGSGAFATSHTIPLQGRAPSVHVSDIDADGAPEVLVPLRDFCRETEGEVFCSVAILDGFEDRLSMRHERRTVDTAVAPVALRTADFNRDGRADLVVGTLSHALVVQFAREDGSFTPPQQIAQVGFPSGLATGDFDGDGTEDIAFSSGAAPAGAWVLFNDTPRAGMLWNGTSVQIETDSVGALVTGQFDGDAHEDIAMTFGQNGPLRVYVNAGTHHVAPTPIESEVGGHANTLAAADLDGDGASDIVLGAQAGAGVAHLRFVYNLRADGRFRARDEVEHAFANGVAPRTLLATDLDGDGDPDVAATQIGSGVSALSTVSNPARASSRHPRAIMSPVGGVLGSVTSAALSDDAYLNVAADETLAVLVVHFAGIAQHEDGLLELEVDAKACGGPVEAEARLLNWETRRWERAFGYTLRNVDDSHGHTLAASPYVSSSGKVRLMLVHEQLWGSGVHLDRVNARSHHPASGDG